MIICLIPIIILTFYCRKCDNNEFADQKFLMILKSTFGEYFINVDYFSILQVINISWPMVNCIFNMTIKKSSGETELACIILWDYSIFNHKENIL